MNTNLLSRIINKYEAKPRDDGYNNDLENFKITA